MTMVPLTLERGTESAMGRCGQDIAVYGACIPVDMAAAVFVVRMVIDNYAL